MVELQVATINGVNSVVGDAAIEEFREGLRGRLILPSDDSYNDARKIWNVFLIGARFEIAVEKLIERRQCSDRGAELGVLGPYAYVVSQPLISSTGT